MLILIWGWVLVGVFLDEPSASLMRCLQVLRCAVDFLICRELNSLLSETTDTATSYLM